jgi:hypothetical protein
MVNENTSVSGSVDGKLVDSGLLMADIEWWKKYKSKEACE